MEDRPFGMGRGKRNRPMDEGRSPLKRQREEGRGKMQTERNEGRGTTAALGRRTVKNKMEDRSFHSLRRRKKNGKKDDGRSLRLDEGRANERIAGL